MHKKGISLFSVEQFLSYRADNFPREAFCVSKKLWYQKFSFMGRGGITVLSKIFRLKQPKWKNFVRKHFCVSDLSGMENSLLIRGKVLMFSGENILSQVAKTFCGKPFNVSRKFGMSKKLMHNRGVSRFCVEFFSLRGTKNIVGQPVCVSEIFCYQKTSLIGRGGITNLTKIFCLRLPKKLWWNPSVFQKKSGTEKLHAY